MEQMSTGSARDLGRPARPARFIEFTSHMLVADERADVFDGREVAQAAREDELRAMVREHVVQ